MTRGGHPLKKHARALQDLAESRGLAPLSYSAALRLAEEHIEEAREKVQDRATREEVFVALFELVFPKLDKKSA